jgi:hypothetical protein
MGNDKKALVEIFLNHAVEIREIVTEIVYF